MTPGGCTTCGETYDNDDFGTDGNGYLILIHVCSRATIARRHERFERNAHAEVLDLWCMDCDRPYQGTASSTRCRPCVKVYRARADAAARANLAKGRAQKCADCGRPRTKRSDRCRYHQRHQRIRKATIPADGRLVRPEEAA